MRGRGLVVVAGATFLLLLAGCGAASLVGRADGPIRVDGPLLVSGTESDGGSLAAVHGGVALDDGCLLVSGMPVVWPYGTSWDAERERVVLVDGRTIAMGDGIDAGGGYASQAEQSSFGYDERAAERLATRCLRWGSTEVIYLNPDGVTIRPGEGGPDPLAPPAAIAGDEPTLPTPRAIAGVWRDPARPELGPIAFGRSAGAACVERFRRGRPVAGGFFPLIPVRRPGCDQAQPWHDYLARTLRRGWVVGDRLHLFGDGDEPIAVLERVG